MRVGRKLEAELASAGAVLIRAKNHAIYRLPTGQNFVTGKTPSDVRAENNAIRILHRLIAQGGAKLQ